MNTFYMFHGRYDPDENLDDWGFNGPELQAVVGMNWTYGECRLLFASAADAKAAQDQTGWENWDENQLLPEFHEDLLKITNREGQIEYYGDWQISLPLSTTNFYARNK